VPSHSPVRVPPYHTASFCACSLGRSLGTHADKSGGLLENQQDTPPCNRNKPNYVLFGNTVHIQTLTAKLKPGSAIIFEFKHFKPKKKKVSNRAHPQRRAPVEHGTGCRGRKKSRGGGLRLVVVGPLTPLTAFVTTQVSTKAWALMEYDEFINNDRSKLALEMCVHPPQPSGE
jgi:hypothetical protein